MNAMCVEKSSPRTPNSFCIKEFTLGKNPTNVVPVGKRFAKNRSSPNIRGFTQARSRTNAMNVAKHFLRIPISVGIIKHTDRNFPKKGKRGKRNRRRKDHEERFCQSSLEHTGEFTVRKTREFNNFHKLALIVCQTT